MKYRFAVTLEPQFEDRNEPLNPDEVKMILEAVITAGMRRIGHTPATLKVSVEKMRALKDMVEG